MADLIDRAALFADIDEAVVYSGRIGTNAEMRGANKIVDRIKAAKAVDAVEVVRCKDCKFLWKKNMLCVHPKRLQGMIAFCECEENDYCSYGERGTDVDKRC